MAIEAKEILEYLGFDPEKVQSLEDLKPSFEKEFIKASNLSEDNPALGPVLGRIYGKQESELKKLAKEFELDLDNDDYRANKMVTEKTKFVLSKLNEKQSSVIAELKTKASQGNDEKVKELEKKLAKIAQEKADIDNLLNTTKTEYQQFQEKSKGEIKSVKLGIRETDALSKVKFKSDISEIEKRGFMSKIKEEYVLDLGDDDSLIVKDKTGARIPSTKKAGDFKSYDEVLEEVAVKEKLYQLNDSAKKQQVSATSASQTPNNATQQNQFPQRRVMEPLK